MTDTPEDVTCDPAPTPAPRTTAERVSAYYDELIAAGFAREFAGEAALRVLPTQIDDVELQSDLDDVPTSVGSITVDMVPRLDASSLERVAEEIKFIMKGKIGTGEDGAPTHA